MTLRFGFRWQAGFRPRFVFGLAALAIALACGDAPGGRSLLAAEGKEPFIPRRQDKPPGPALTPAEAIKKMTVPEGFTVECVASEPMLVNPTAFTFDDRGRMWICESFEYPRREPGKGRDRIKILEDTDGDGAADKETIFAEGLNIPCGIAIGYGGVWVTNAPDILFLQDTNGDDKADKSEVVVTGFGRDDTHELPNSLTWGPDGWLYGLNGVFNHSHVKQNGKDFDFTCTLFRIHPRTREFQLWCEGTSNPWGVAFDREGSAFISACVIDHLWHLVESGYYHRQGGPYPPFTWKLESIVKHKHQMAAYCGLTYYDSDVYPEQYRQKLYMGNIHGNCLNCDSIERRGASYFATGNPDFLSANDVWFMPVSQKTGPDGCMYVLDWYDRYHCYQDANADPEGVDRAKGRLYRIRYGNAPRRVQFDMAKLTDAELIQKLESGVSYDREVAQRLLSERATPEIQAALTKLITSEGASLRGKRIALWALIGCGEIPAETHLKLLAHGDSTIRAFAVRAAGDQPKLADSLVEPVLKLADDPAIDVRLQVAIAAKKIGAHRNAPGDAIPVLLHVLAKAGDDGFTPHIVWQNLHPLLETHGATLAAWLNAHPDVNTRGLTDVLPRVCERLLAKRGDDPSGALAFAQALLASPGRADSARGCLALFAQQTLSRELAGAKLAALQKGLTPSLHKTLDDPKSPLYLDAALLAAAWRDERGFQTTRDLLADSGRPSTMRRQALEALVAANDAEVTKTVGAILADPKKNPADLRSDALAALGRLDRPEVGEIVLKAYPQLEPDLQPRAVELLTQRDAWSKLLLAAIGAKTVPADALNVNQVRKLLGSKDKELADAVRKQWGSLRVDRDPKRDLVVAQMRRLIRSTQGDAVAGHAVFKKVCGQCHQIYGEGQNVGPDVTVNGRSNFTQLLSNVFDPSLVIGAAYQAYTVETADGRTITGLLAEDNPQRVVLKAQGGKLETIARDDVVDLTVSPLSLMPEGIEKQLSPKEIADLFAFLTLDKNPADKSAKRMSGVYEVAPRETSNPAEFNDVLSEIALGFTTTKVGEGGVAILAEHKGRKGVLRTHPVSQQEPTVLRSKVDVPKEGKTTLELSVASHQNGDWKLVVKANGKVIHSGDVGKDIVNNGWQDLSIDLTPFAGQSVDLEVQNSANGWAYEHGFWGRVEIVNSTDAPK
ncbi:MAG TPA: PVC-type heme-binding CxxCH protein [Pirellulales bacterium]